MRETLQERFITRAESGLAAAFRHVVMPLFGRAGRLLSPYLNNGLLMSGCCNRLSKENLRISVYYQVTERRTKGVAVEKT
jgi:hypothetical protein